MAGFRSLRRPAIPDTAAPDFDAQCTRFWEESHAWWDNWEHNFGLAMVLLLLAFAVALALLIAA